MSSTKPEAPAEGEGQDPMHPEPESAKISRRIKTPKNTGDSEHLEAVQRDLSAVTERVQAISDEVAPVLEELETAVQDVARMASTTANVVTSMADDIARLNKINAARDEFQPKAAEVLNEITSSQDWLKTALTTQAESITDLEDRPAVPQVFEAVHRLMQRVEAIGKEGTYEGGRSGRYKFRRVDDVMDAVGHAMRDVGLVMQTQVVSGPSYTTSQVTNREGYVTEWTTCRATIAYTFIDIRDGSRHTIEMPGEGRDSSDKATSKAMAMAMKYALVQGLCIPLESEQDPDNERPTIERQASAQRPQQAPPQRPPASSPPAQPAARPASPPPAQQQETPPDNRAPDELARAAIKALRSPGLTEARFHEIMDYIWSERNEQLGLSQQVVDGQRVVDVVNATAATLGLQPVGGGS